MVCVRMLLQMLSVERILLRKKDKEKLGFLLLIFSTTH